MTRKILAVLVATLLSSVASADRGGDVFKAMDANRDQRLTQNEVSGNPELWQQFAALDRDSNGYLTQEEYAAYMKMKDNDQNK
jgi:hypothetical protein